MTISPADEETPPKLTLSDPIDAETLKRFEDLQTLRIQLADRLLDLEQEKVKTMRAVSNVDAERQRLFDSVLISRGLPPTSPVQIDAKTGQITLLQEPLAKPAAEAPVASA